MEDKEQKKVQEKGEEKITCSGEEVESFVIKLLENKIEQNSTGEKQYFAYLKREYKYRHVQETQCMNTHMAIC